MYPREEVKSLISFFWKQAPFLSRTKHDPGWAASSRVRDNSSGAVPLGLWDLLSHTPQSSKCNHGMLTHMLDIRKTRRQETSICPPSKKISLGKQAGQHSFGAGWCQQGTSALRYCLLLRLRRNFPSRFSPSPHLYIYKSSSYLLLRWHEAFLSDLLSFVEFLPSPAWKIPVCCEEEKKSNSSFYGLGFSASQELGFSMTSFPKAL